MSVWVIAGALVLLIIAGICGICALPGYFYRFVFARKAPQPGTAAFKEAGEEAARREPRPWIETMPYETVQIRSRDGLVLQGYFLAAHGQTGGLNLVGNASSANTMILAHGYTGNAKQLSLIAQLAYETLGFNILLPDARGHGGSEGSYIGFGWPDRLDYLQWIGWVKARSGPPAADGSPGADGQARIVLFGISMGAATVMMTGGEDLPPEVKAIIEDCGYTSVGEELFYQMKWRYHIQSALLYRATNRITQKRLGFSFEDASSLEQVKKIRVPTLFIHGDADTFVPTQMVYPLYEACTAPKELFIAPGAGHGEAYNSNPGEYTNRVHQFLRKYVL
jgi:fermentation-respiration switch protein FrsA (DUF1100 family)